MTIKVLRSRRLLRISLIVPTALLSLLLLAGTVSAENEPRVCSIRTFNGHYLTAVGGGGRISDVIHTDATQVQAWERFTLENLNLGTPNITYGLKTSDGHYLTVVGGGGRISDVIHSDATQPRAWEQFVLERQKVGVFWSPWSAIKTVNGNYLTATGGGGHGNEVPESIHSDATKVDDWERFQIGCPLIGL